MGLLGANKGFNLQVERLPGKGLSGRFLVPPFSVLSARDGEWQRRKRQWIALGIESEVGRGGLEDSCSFKNQNKLT
ncbi:hypothetical protein DRN75_04225, partial [Nanoarchaeota archaeon]